MGSATNVLNEYLVRLGFSTDKVAYAQFASSLKDAARLVDNQYLAMAKKVTGFAAASAGAFAAFGASVIGVADKVAMADQEYRLLALHMYTSLPVARELKIALDALGQPLENVMWDPELAKRFHQLVADQQAMTKALGPDFENQMYKIRDVRFEFTRLGVEVKYLTMLVVEDLAKAFGTDMDGLLLKFRRFNSYLIENLPQIASWITSRLVPVLQDVGEVMSSVWGFTKQLVTTFTNLIALLSNDKALETSTADWRKFGTALVGVANLLADVTAMLFNLGKNIATILDAGVKAMMGDFKGAAKNIHSMQPIDANLPSQKAITTRDAGPKMPSVLQSVQQAIAAQAKSIGLDPRLGLAVAAVESGGGDVNAIHQFDKFGKPIMPGLPNSHAMGIFQLQPRTARDMGVNAADTEQNIKGGLKYLQGLIIRYGSEEQALQHYYGSGNPSQNKAYASRVMHVESGIHLATGAISITVQGGNSSPDKIKWAVVDALKESHKNETQRALAEFQTPGFSY